MVRSTGVATAMLEAVLPKVLGGVRRQAATAVLDPTPGRDACGLLSEWFLDLPCRCDLGEVSLAPW